MCSCLVSANTLAEKQRVSMVEMHKDGCPWKTRQCDGECCLSRTARCYLMTVQHQYIASHYKHQPPWRKISNQTPQSLKVFCLTWKSNILWCVYAYLNFWKMLIFVLDHGAGRLLAHYYLFYQPSCSPDIRRRSTIKPQRSCEAFSGTY